MDPKDQENNVNEDEKIEDQNISSEDENTEEDDTSKNDPASDEEDDGDENTENNEDEDPYEKKLKELEEQNKKLEEEKKKQDEMLRQKSAALKEERLKNKKPTEEGSDEEKPLTKKEMLELLEAREKRQQDLQAIKEVSNDPNEQKLIKVYVDQGYSVEDAYLKANAHLIQKAKDMEAEEMDLSERESYLTKFSAGASRGSKGRPKYERNPILKEAAKELDPEDRKYLNSL